MLYTDNILYAHHTWFAYKHVLLIRAFSCVYFFTPRGRAYARCYITHTGSHTCCDVHHIVTLPPLSRSWSLTVCFVRSQSHGRRSALVGSYAALLTLRNWRTFVMRSRLRKGFCKSIAPISNSGTIENANKYILSVCAESYFFFIFFPRVVFIFDKSMGTRSPMKIYSRFIFTVMFDILT